MRLDLLAGARYFKLDLDFDADVGARKIKYSDSGDVLDGIIGAQVIILKRAVEPCVGGASR